MAILVCNTCESDMKKPRTHVSRLGWGFSDRSTCYWSVIGRGFLALDVVRFQELL